MSLSYEELRDAVAGDVVGIRFRNVLEPLGGVSDKVFPPTYGGTDNAETRYAIETRYAPAENGQESHAVRSVVLDSVASQANRFELALLDAIRSDEIQVPVTSVDFRPIEGLAGLDRISDYEASHRIFDALLRDSYDGEHLFRNGAAGVAVTSARPRDAAGLFHHSPHTLLFGGWDSTGPRGGLGAKYERAITSEIVALGIETGVRTASRIDMTGIQSQAGPLYLAPDGTWTLDETKAVHDEKTKKPKLLGSDKAADKGRPSQANLGNVTPNIDRKAGGVTAREIVGTTVISFIQLRRLRFPTGPDGVPFEGAHRSIAELAAHVALATLGLAAMTLAFGEGFDLRSRCVLVTTTPSTFEAIGRDGVSARFDLTTSEALKLVTEAAEHAAAADIPWRPGELSLRPSDRLVDLIKRSHQLSQAQIETGKP
jgi:CRISPR-associated protein Csb1